MKFIADFHIHSHFSRATSRDLDPEHLWVWSRKKGITVVGTGDFTHPGWVSELQEKLVEAEEGLYRLRPAFQEGFTKLIPPTSPGPTRFILSGEISCIYKKTGKTRKVHHLILMPDMASVMRLNERLSRIGNITSDGRPILGLDSRDLLEMILDASEKAFLIPAHIWTPWFSLLGSKSGFDSLEECFEDLSPHVHALETGLSSDPPMNRRLSSLDSFLLVSNSDAHSPGKIGREANLFEAELDYDRIVQSMATGSGFLGTVEFFPEEGKYHLDGHRKCEIRFDPQETRAHKETCPVCGRALTVGVLHRVDELSDRDHPKVSKGFISLVPLPEILCELLDCGPSSKAVTALYERLLSTLGPELKILMDFPLKEIEDAGGPLLAEAVRRMRSNQVIRDEGYDGQYGTIRLFEPREKESFAGQIGLFREKRGLNLRAGTPSPRAARRMRRNQAAKAMEIIGIGDPILDPLNAQQREAVLYEGGSLLIVAGPGTGKTMTLTHRIAHLVRSGMPTRQILALTFTRKAADEIKDRITALLGQAHSEEEVEASTFHRFCFKIIQAEGERIGLPRDINLCSEFDAEGLVREILSERKALKLAPRFFKEVPNLKRLSALGLFEELDGHEFLPFFEKYQARLRQLGLLDLDDLEAEILKLFQRFPDVCMDYGKRYPHIFVDEFQDTNQNQVDILKRLGLKDTGKICAIGDRDQAIYGFRGARVENFDRFTEDFPGAKVVVLTKNYRSIRAILEGSAAMLGKGMPLECQSAKTDFIYIAQCHTDTEEAEMIVEQIERLIGGTSYFSLDSGRVASHDGEDLLGFGDIAVLFRLNSQGGALENALGRAGVPFRRSGEKPLVTHYPVNVLWRFLQVLHSPGNPFYEKAYESVLREANAIRDKRPESFCPGGTITELIDRAVQWHELDTSTEEATGALGRLREAAKMFGDRAGDFLDALSLERGIDHASLLGDRVALMSLHSAKGLEWPVVFIAGCEDRLIPCSLFGDMDEEEERRLFYVGMTRAKWKLFLSHTERRSLNGRILQMSPSRFLDAIPANLTRRLQRASWRPKKKLHEQLGLFLKE